MCIAAMLNHAVTAVYGIRVSVIPYKLHKNLGNAAK